MTGPSNDRLPRRVPVILVRHGLTEWNDLGLIQGWTDIPLSPLGRRQAEATARALAGRPISAVASSDLVRARETAEAIARAHGLTPTLHADLREYHCGEWEGRPFLEVRRDHPDAFRAWFNDAEAPIPGGESMGAALRRAGPAVDALLASLAGEGALVLVGHGGINRVLAAHFLAMPLAHARRFMLDNASISIFEPHHSGWALRSWNHTGHLDALADETGGDARRTDAPRTN
ncbi:MAG TPA: histidine phosphatase family protein [Candidatus Eisenbacteria bacterium]